MESIFSYAKTNTGLAEVKVTARHFYMDIEILNWQVVCATSTCFVHLERYTVIVNQMRIPKLSFGFSIRQVLG